MSLETGLPADAHQILWRAPYGGRSTPVVVDGRVFAINLAGEGVTEQERVLAFDLANGRQVWEHRFNVFHTDIPNSRVGWASVAVDRETGNVYAHGVEGMFFCFDRDGGVIWSRSLTETLGRISGYGGRTHTPVVDEDRVVVSFLNSSFGDQAVGKHRYLAMDKRTGEILWWSTPGGKPQDTTYSTPVVSVVDGVRLLVAGNADGGIYAMKARTGEMVWGFQLSKRGINASVVVDGHRVYATHSEENVNSTEMGRVVCIDARGSGHVTKTHEIWRHDGVAAGYASPALLGDRLYVMDNFGVLYAFDAQTGGKAWEHTVGRVGKGSPVCADGKIYVATVNGKFAVLEDTGTACKQLDALDLESDRGVVELFGSPAIADGRVVFFTTEEMICLGREGAGAVQVDEPTWGVEKPADANAAPSLMQVRPAEVLIQPGDDVPFRAVAFDENGRELGEADCEWSCPSALGAVSGDGVFRPAQRGGAVGTVSATCGDLTATARVRIVPELPVAEDFESYDDGAVPDWWIGVSKAKHAVETVDGSKVLKKLADARGPSFNRSRVYVTPPLPAGYTVQADVLGVKEGRRRGDVGLINARYRLELYGNVNRLRVMSWVPGPRFEKRTEFTFEPDRWYTMKFHVAVKGGEAHLRAKVWPRDESEPDAWTLEAVDPQPNLEGSAGIYAYSMAPLLYDNVRVYR
ncbi:MAG: outer membrane protein assembly factor BamB family protein [Planctomycetota bacterium]